jgi:hypothetical protein
VPFDATRRYRRLLVAVCITALVMIDCVDKARNDSVDCRRGRHVLWVARSGNVGIRWGGVRRRRRRRLGIVRRWSKMVKRLGGCRVICWLAPRPAQQRHVVCRSSRNRTTGLRGVRIQWRIIGASVSGKVGSVRGSSGVAKGATLDESSDQLLWHPSVRATNVNGRLVTAPVCRCAV